MITDQNFPDYVRAQTLPAWIRPQVQITAYDVVQGQITFDYTVVRGSKTYKASKTLSGFQTRPLTMRLTDAVVSAKDDQVPRASKNPLPTAQYVLNVDGPLKAVGINQVDLLWLYTNNWLYAPELLRCYGVDQSNLSEFFSSFHKDLSTGTISFDVRLPAQTKFHLPAIDQRFSFKH